MERLFSKCFQFFQHSPGRIKQLSGLEVRWRSQRITALYSQCCGEEYKLAGVSNGAAYKAWNDSMMQVLEQLHSSQLEPTDLDLNLFLHTKNNLIAGANSGLAQKLMDVNYDTPDYAMLSKMKANIYAFSGAHTYAELSEMNALLYDANGRLVSKEVFRAEALAYYAKAGKIDVKYASYLDTEHNMAIATGTKARQWSEFMENVDLFPNLKYVTAGDNHVRKSHELLNGIILPKRHVFWLTNYPPNDWNCRCDAHETDEAATPEVAFTPAPGFDFNAGIDGTAFSPSHPYYPQAKKDRERIQQRVDQWALDEHIKRNRKIYEQYASDPDYVQVGFDDNSGGFIIQHKGADLLEKHEERIIELLKDKGERIVLPELSKARFTKSNDLSLNESAFEIKKVDSHKKAGLRLREAMEQASNCILTFSKKPSYAFVKGMLSKASKEVIRLNTIMIEAEGNFATITKKELLNDDFSALLNW